MEPSEVVAGLAALLLAAAAIDAGFRAYRINLGTHVAPTIPATELPPEASVAFAPLARLAARERGLADHIAALPDPVAADTWVRAATAARALRAHALRITAAEQVPGAGKDPGDALARLVLRLREGVSAYERLTDIAAEAANDVACGRAPRDAAFRLADATEALVGMIRGLPS
ncbi:MAG: hypothetical protein H0U22_16505 [Geodermatophilaceae bacterium]|nr:hypothetical protein [Geodermatophilaceae bacterium]